MTTAHSTLHKIYTAHDLPESPETLGEPTLTTPSRQGLATTASGGDPVMGGGAVRLYATAETDRPSSSPDPDEDGDSPCPQCGEYDCICPEPCPECGQLQPCRCRDSYSYDPYDYDYGGEG